MNSCNECIEEVGAVGVEVLVPVELAGPSLQLPVKKGSALDGMMLPV